MSKLLFKIEQESNYTCVLLHPNRDLGYFGTDDGVVEIWDLNKQEKLTELRYLKLNEFNEQIPVEDPVVNLAAPSDFKFVYAFMGIAAYCIDTKLGVIVQKIPISEKVLWGAVSPELGEIGVLTTTGYLSRWSPKFVERVGSIEFDRSMDFAYVIHDIDESRIILVFPDDSVVLTNLTGERYKIDFQIDDSSEYLNFGWYDRSPKYQGIINSNGSVSIYNSEDSLEIVKNTPFEQGQKKAEERLKQMVYHAETTDTKKEYITDVRLHRQSRDRYDAEVESLGKSSHHIATEEEDSKTLHFAMNEYEDEDYQVKSKAMTVLNKLTNRNEIKSKYVYFAWRNRAQPTQLIEKARYYEYLTEFRKSRLIKYLLFNIIFSFIFLYISISFNISIEISITLISIAGPVLIIHLFLRKINSNPNLPWINEFKGFQYFYISLMLIGLVMIVDAIFELGIISILPSG